MRYILIFLCLNFLSIANAQTFDELLKLVADDRAEGDRFGYSLDIHENLAIIGAYGADYGASPNMGAAYIYENSGDSDWALVQKINNSDQDNYDRFGWSVSINENYAVVGAYAEDDNELDEDAMTRAGSAYVFQRNEEGVWVEMQKLIASDRAENAQFGWSVSLDETTIAVGANFESFDDEGEDYI